MRNSKSPAPFARMPWYPRDFASATRGWPLVARAIYRELLDAQWDQGGSAGPGTLPAEQEALQLIAGASNAEWKAAWRLIESKFPVVEGGRRNARLEVHRQGAIRQYEARRRGAQTTNTRRWGNGSLSDSVSESLSGSVSDN